MLEKVKSYVDKWQMLQSEDCVITGVSGGADSVCLLFVLTKLQKEIGFRMVAVHVNHGLRGQEADEDEAYVRRLCEEHGILYESYFRNVELIAKNRKQSTEEAGREIRRACLEEALSKHEGTKIALAHHQDDNAETFLLNLARGTGLRGLGGIRPVKRNVIRPLLCVRRCDIEEYLKENNIMYRTDSTNQSDVYTRNRIRNHILPYMEENLNVKTVDHMNETMDQLRQVEDYLEEQTEYFCGQCVREIDTGYLIMQEAYAEVPKVIGPLLLRKVMADVCGKEKDLEAIHLRQLQELFDKQTGRRLDLPYEMEARRVYAGVEIGLKKEEVAYEEEVCWRLEEPEIHFSWGHRKVCCRIVDKTEIDGETDQKSYTKRFDCDIISGMVCFRTRRQGDYITIHPDGRTQKLKSFFINEKVPHKDRDKLLIVADGNHVLWIEGYRVNPAFQITEHTKRVLEININEGESYDRDN